MAAAEIPVPDAIAKAKQYLNEVLPEYANVPWQLEEVETDNSSRWYFTFSATFPSPPSQNSLADILRGFRMTKSVEIEPSTGKLLAIRNKAA